MLNPFDAAIFSVISDVDIFRKISKYIWQEGNIPSWQWESLNPKVSLLSISASFT